MTHDFPHLSIPGLNIAAFDLRPAQTAIKEKYGAGFHLDSDCLTEIASLWQVSPGDGLINSSGVFTNPAEAIELQSGKCNCTISLASTPSSLWAMSVSLQLSRSGLACPLSVWNSIAFATRGDAIACAVHGLQNHFRNIGLSSPDAASARKLCVQLADVKAPQLELF